MTESTISGSCSSSGASILNRVLLKEGDALPVRIFECLFTLTFLVWMSRCLMTWRDWQTPQGFHLTTEELNSMGYPFALPAWGMWNVLLFVCIVVSGAVLLLWPLQKAPIFQLKRQAGLALLSVAAILAQKIDHMASFTLNKLFIGVFVLLLIAPGFKYCLLSGRHTQPLLVLRLLQATLILQYFAAGLAKMDGDWLKSADLLWEHVQGVYRTEIAAWALINLPRWTWGFQQYMSLIFEVAAPVFFILPKLRGTAFILGIGFHLMIALMMKDLIFFSAQMWTFYALFVTAEQWRTIGNALAKWTGFRHGLTASCQPG